MKETELHEDARNLSVQMNLVRVIAIVVEWIVIMILTEKLCDVACVLTIQPQEYFPNLSLFL